jgi:hypothetical protein
MADLISFLDDSTATRILESISRAHGGGPSGESELSEALREAMREESGVQPTPNPVSDGDVARAALQVLAQNDDFEKIIKTMAKNPPPEKLGIPVTELALLTAVVFVLKSEFEIKRDKSGRYSFLFRSKPLDKSILKEFITQVSNWLPKGRIAR